MRSLGAVERVGSGIGFHFLGGGVGIRVGYIGGFTLPGRDRAVGVGEERSCDKRNAEDVARMWSASEGRGKIQTYP